MGAKKGWIEKNSGLIGVSGLGLGMVGVVASRYVPSLPLLVSDALLGFGLILAILPLLVAVSPGAGGNASNASPGAISVGGNVGDRSVVGHKNVVDHSTTVNEAPPPELGIGQEKLSVKTEKGEFETSFLIEIVAPYPPSRLNFQIRGSHLLRAEVHSLEGGMTMRGGDSLRDETLHLWVQSPWGRYRLTVWTSAPADLEIGHAFD